MSILLNLKRIVNKGTSNTLTFVIICSLVIFGGMSKIDIANKVTIFQGLKIDVTIQLDSKHCPFVIGIHSMAH